MLLLREGEDASWELVGAMAAARCGHGSAALPSGAVVAAGGYGGGSTYHRSAELLLTATFEPQPLPPMSDARTGFNLCAGPDGRVYAAGGSPDGTRGLASAEALDPRERAWRALPTMPHARSYTTSAFDPCGRLHVHGGCGNRVVAQYGALAVHNSLDVYDVRMNRWSTFNEKADDPDAEPGAAFDRIEASFPQSIGWDGAPTVPTRAFNFEWTEAEMSMLPPRVDHSMQVRCAPCALAVAHTACPANPRTVVGHQAARLGPVPGPSPYLGVGRGRVVE